MARKAARVAKNADDEIEVKPKKLYSLTQAARLIPSCQAGKSTHIRTLRTWIAAGILKAVSRQHGKVRHWFVPGSEILRLTDVPDDFPPQQTRGPKQREREYERACKELEARGL